MTDRFEQRLSLELRTLAEAGVRPIDRHAVADAAIERGRRRGVASLLADRLGIGAARPWAPPLPLAVRLAIVVALVAAALAAAAAGGWITRLAPWLRGPFPIVEELGQLGAGQVSSFRAALLADGRVLLVGGVDTTVGQRTLGDAWIFDPDTKSLVPTAPLGSPRADPVLVGLADGRVLVFGGYFENSTTGEQGTVPTAELYDPSSGTFRETSGLPAARRSCPCGAFNDLPWAIPQASLLRDGRIFVTGGQPIVNEGVDQVAAASRADLYDPVFERWSQLDIGCDASRGTQTLLRDGRLLILCVTGSSGMGSREVDVRARLFNPATNAFDEAPRPPSPARRATRLSDGRILLTGFAPTIYDPGRNTFELVPLGAALSGQVGIVVRDDRVLFLGDPADREIEYPTFLLDTTGFRITSVERPAFATADAVTQLRDGRILTVGYRFEARLLDPAQLP